jgi:6-phosphogluconolactonase
MYELAISPTPEDAALDVARRIAGSLQEAQDARGVAHIALAGGNTPRRVYELLGPLLHDWSGVHIWFGDERAVPPDDPDSNFRLVSESLLPAAGIPDEHVHRVVGEWPPEEAAETYSAELLRVVPSNASGVPVLDVAFLGLGEDGHTASLFPGDPLIGVSGKLVRAVTAPKPPPDRITLTLDVLYAARRAILLASGEGKREAVAALMKGPDPQIPASLLPHATTVLVVDAAAAPPVR